MSGQGRAVGTVIFLDFDGVLLNQASHFRTMDVACVALLDALCRDTGAAVVISSTWRHIGLRRCRAMLREAGFTGTVLGVTPVLWGCSRGEEIDRWLDAHPDTRRFCILDDDADMGGLTPALVRTATLVGLTEAGCQAARCVLGGGMSGQGRAVGRATPRRRAVGGLQAKVVARVTPAAPHIPERQLQELVRRTALAFNWGYYHTWNSRKSAPGYPDCTLVKGRRLLYIELKTATGKLTPHQEQWGAALRRVPGVEYYVWRPEQWRDGTIEAILRGE